MSSRSQKRDFTKIKSTEKPKGNPEQRTKQSSNIPGFLLAGTLMPQVTNTSSALLILTSEETSGFCKQ